jgi:hypothetical protein
LEGAVTEFHSVKAFAREEPRIELIEATLRSLLALVELEFEGQPVQVDGFRLRDLEDWRTAPEESLQPNLGSLSTVCNCSCAFCYEQGNPPGLFETEPRFVGMREARTRRRYLHDGRGLPRESKSTFEPLANPHILDLLRLMRDGDPERLIELTTNGALLKEEMIARLAELKPVWVNLSLNSADPEVRRKIMGDLRSDRTTRVPEILRSFEIPFTGSLVPWPEQGVDDLIATLEYLDICEARVVRVAMPALTRHHPHYDSNALREWIPAVRDAVEVLRHRIRTPVLISPFTHVTNSLDPIVEGVVRRSPAEAAGIEIGDRLLAIDGRQVASRAHASSLLAKAQPMGRAAVEIKRGDEHLEVLLQEPAEGLDLYPYRPQGYRRLDFSSTLFGLCLPDSFHLSYVKRIHEEMLAHEAKRVIVLASAHLHELVAGLLEGLPVPSETDIEVLVPENRFFGGDVDVGDLWVLDDIAASVREYTREAGPADLLVIPDSFLSRWGQDLLGVPFTELEAALGLKVALVPCERILV